MQEMELNVNGKHFDIKVQSVTVFTLRPEAPGPDSVYVNGTILDAQYPLDDNTIRIAFHAAKGRGRKLIEELGLTDYLEQK